MPVTFLLCLVWTLDATSDHVLNNKCPEEIGWLQVLMAI